MTTRYRTAFHGLGSSGPSDASASSAAGGAAKSGKRIKPATSTAGRRTATRLLSQSLAVRSADPLIGAAPAKYA